MGSHWRGILVYCLLEGLRMAVLDTPKHVALLIDVNNKEFGCVRLKIVYHYIYVILVHSVEEASVREVQSVVISTHMQSVKERSLN
jgi:hypothetical protein